MVITRDWEWGKWGDICQRVQTFSYTMNKFWGPNIKHSDYIPVNNTELYA